MKDLFNDVPEESVIRMGMTSSLYYEYWKAVNAIQKTMVYTGPAGVVILLLLFGLVSKSPDTQWSSFGLGFALAALIMALVAAVVTFLHVHFIRYQLNASVGIKAGEVKEVCVAIVEDYVLGEEAGFASQFD